MSGKEDTYPTPPVDCLKVLHLVPQVDDFDHKTINALALFKFFQSKGISADEVKSIGREDKSIRVEFSRRGLYPKLGQGNTINGIPTRTTFMFESNLLHGVVRHKEIELLTSAELTELLKMGDPQVAACKKLTPSTARVFFLGDHLPKEVSLAWDVVAVEPYIPPPTRCFKCQRYGHPAKKCGASEAVCSTCSETGHRFDTCRATTVKCAACGGPHSAADSTCPKWKEERKVRKVVALQGKTYREALLQVQQKKTIQPARPAPPPSTPAQPTTSETSTTAPASSTAPAEASAPATPAVTRSQSRREDEAAAVVPDDPAPVPDSTPDYSNKKKKKPKKSTKMPTSE